MRIKKEDNPSEKKTVRKNRHYTSPRLIRYGKLTELTTALSGVVSDVMAGLMSPG